MLLFIWEKVTSNFIEEEKEEKEDQIQFCTFENCDYGSANISDLENHIKGHGKTVQQIKREKQAHSCIHKDCDFRTYNKKELLYHRRTVHSKEFKPTECVECRITYNRESVYINHYIDSHGHLPPGRVSQNESWHAEQYTCYLQIVPSNWKLYIHVGNQGHRNGFEYGGDSKGTMTFEPFIVQL